MSNENNPQSKAFDLEEPQHVDYGQNNDVGNQQPSQQQQQLFKEPEPVDYGQDDASLEDVAHLKDPDFKNVAANQEQPKFDDQENLTSNIDAPLDLEKAAQMNPVAENANKSSNQMGEFAPILESNNPSLPTIGPFKDPKTGATYLGQFMSGKKEGLGKEVYQNGSYYEGHWRNGVRQGQGRFVSHNGDLFQGEFNNNKAEGQGTLYTSATQTTYTGGFENDKPHGKGKEEYSDGSFYMGDFKEGQMTGKCKFIFKDGGIYNGEVINGMATGKGKYTYKNSNKTYEGDFKNNKKHGKGTLVLEKYTYTGKFRDGQMSGPGQLVWNDGKKLIGNFDKGRPHGAFEQVTKDGDVKKVMYDKGKFMRNL